MSRGPSISIAVFLMVLLPLKAKAAGGCCDHINVDPLQCNRPGPTSKAACDFLGGTWHPDTTCQGDGLIKRCRPALPKWAGVSLTAMLAMSGALAIRKRMHETET